MGSVIFNRLTATVPTHNELRILIMYFILREMSHFVIVTYFVDSKVTEERTMPLCFKYSSV